MPVEYRVGDAAHPEAEGKKLIAHVVNSVGAWGSGFVVAVSDIYGDSHKAQYLAWMKTHRPQMGAVLITDAGNDIYIAHMLAQNGLRSQFNETPLVYAALSKCLNTVAERAKAMNATVHMPRVGMGRGGGDWKRIEAAVTRAFPEQTVSVYDLPPRAPSDPFFRSR